MTDKPEPHILVLEDDPAVQTLLRKQLTANGFKVTVASDGLDGLMKLEKLRPDIMICDVMMPNLDGMEFVKAVKSNRQTQRIPVIFLTAKSDPRSMIEANAWENAVHSTTSVKINQTWLASHTGPIECWMSLRGCAPSSDPPATRSQNPAPKSAPANRA